MRKYYKSIKELPAINWIELHETEDFTKISKTGKICKRASQVFDKLRDEVIDTFGASPEYLKLHRAKIELELLKCEKLWTSDRSLQFHIDMQQREVDEMLNRPVKKTDVYQAFIWIKKQGININENEVTVFWFYKYLNFLIQEAKDSAKAQKANVRK